MSLVRDSHRPADSRRRDASGLRSRLAVRLVFVLAALLLAGGRRFPGAPQVSAGVPSATATPTFTPSSSDTPTPTPTMTDTPAATETPGSTSTDTPSATS